MPTLQDLIQSGDRNAINQFLAKQQITGDSGGVMVGGQPDARLSSLVQQNYAPQEQMQPMRQPMQQPMNTIRTSSGEYLGPSGERSLTPQEFTSQPMQSRPRGSPVDLGGGAKGFMQPDGTIVGFDQQGNRIKVQPVGTEAARQAGIDKGLDRQFMQAKIAGEQAQTQQRLAGGGGLSPSEQLARERFEWEKQKTAQTEPKAAQKVTDASDALMLLQQAAPLVRKSTGSGTGALVDYGASLFGASPEGAKYSARLKAIGGQLIAKMPKMTGPQSDKDVQLYREMAGQIGDPTITTDVKEAAMQTIAELQARYAGVETPQLNFGGEEQQPATAQFSGDKEARYQAWKAQQRR